MVRKEYLIKTKVDFAGCTAPDFCRQLLFIVVYNTFVFHRTDKPTESKPRGFDTLCAQPKNSVYTRYTKTPRGQIQGFEYHF